jgi:intracellular multiplication protein IcmG
MPAPARAPAPAMAAPPSAAANPVGPGIQEIASAMTPPAAVPAPPVPSSAPLTRTKSAHESAGLARAIESDVLAGHMPSGDPKVARLEADNRRLREQVERLERDKGALEKQLAAARGRAPRLAARATHRPTTAEAEGESEAKHVQVASNDLRPSEFRIHAIVPGRAWLQGSNDESFSVTVGDAVPGEGVVKSIDPDKGVVRTTYTVIQ